MTALVAAGKFVASAAGLGLGAAFSRDSLVVFPVPSPTAASAEQTVFAAGFSRPFVPGGALEITCLLGPPLKWEDLVGVS